MFIASACRLGPRHCVPEVKVQKTWHARQAFPEQESDGGVTFSDPLELGEVFEDLLLPQYLNTIACNNHDVKIAYAKVCEAFALRQMTASKLYPSIGGRIDYSRSLPAGGILRSNQDAAAGGSPLGGIPLNLKQQTFLANFDALWELDFFGKTQREVESSTASIHMEIESYYASLISLMAEFGRTYLELRRTQQNLLLLQKEAAILLEKERMRAARLTVGLDSELSYLESKSAIRKLNAEIPLLEGEILHQMYSLSVLLGGTPDSLVEQLRASAPLPRVKRPIPVGFPSDLLRRRPDVRLAERNLAKSTADVGVAVAEFFPKIALDGSYGFQNLHLGAAKGSGESWSYGGNLLTPLFQGGKLRANLKRYQWIRREARVAYEKAVFQALEESESAIARMIASEQSLREKDKVYKAREKIFKHMEERYKRGLVDRLSLLDENINVILAEKEWVNQEADYGIQLIALYKALGGSWKNRFF
jgi:NodT family efflux transporter outer membrane factor (OMF) lipoprotein